MKAHITIQPNKPYRELPDIASSNLAIMHIYIDCQKEKLYEAAEAINGGAGLSESVYAVMWSYYTEQGIILAYCPAVFLTDKELCERECTDIRSTLSAIE